MERSTEYDTRYLEGIRLFNEGDYFEAHEVWEDLWNDCPTEHRRFYQGLIQAAVALYHWSNGNARGPRRLFESGQRHMSGSPESFMGLDRSRFWQEMERALAGIFTEPTTETRLDPALAPKIVLLAGRVSPKASQIA